MRARKILAYSAIYFLWGGSFLAIREVVAVTPPFFSAAFRFFLAGLILIVFTAFAGAGAITRRQLGNLAILGFLMFGCEYACLFWAEQRISSGIASVVSATIPVWIFAGEAFLLRTQRASVASLAGIGLGFLGVIVLAWQSLNSGIAGSSAGVIVALLGTFAWSGGTLLSRKLYLPTSRAASAGWQMAIGGLLLGLLSILLREPRHLLTAFAAWSPHVIASMCYLILAASILTFTAYVWLLGHEPTTRVASYAYINPVVALVLGAVVAGEHLTFLQLLGSVLVLAGVFATLTGKAVSKPVP
jgi:drug/metabolite transporter (DMT)-like permease